MSKSKLHGISTVFSRFPLPEGSVHGYYFWTELWRISRFLCNFRFPCSPFWSSSHGSLLVFFALLGPPFCSFYKFVLCFKRTELLVGHADFDGVNTLFDVINIFMVPSMQLNQAAWKLMFFITISKPPKGLSKDARWINFEFYPLMVWDCNGVWHMPFLNEIG